MIHSLTTIKPPGIMSLSLLKGIRGNLSIPKTFNVQIRNYASPNPGKTVLPPRIKKKLLPGKTRPSIFYQFECKVELSDGSTYTRRSQYPRVEWRYLVDQRNNHLYNPSRTNLKAVEADATGRLAKFSQKFGFVEPPQASNAQESESPEEQEKVEPVKEMPAKQSLMDDYLDIMGEGFVPVQSGGKLAGKKKNKK